MKLFDFSGGSKGLEDDEGGGSCHEFVLILDCERPSPRLYSFLGALFYSFRAFMFFFLDFFTMVCTSSTNGSWFLFFIGDRFEFSFCYISNAYALVSSNCSAIWSSTKECLW